MPEVSRGIFGGTVAEAAGDTPMASLTDAEVKNAKPGEKPRKLADGEGLYLLVNPNGSKLWRQKYRYGGREQLLSHGAYPHVGLAAAREACRRAKEQIRTGKSPSLEKRRAEVAKEAAAVNTFKAVAEHYLELQRTTARGRGGARGLSDASYEKAAWFLKLIDPRLAARPVAEIEPWEVLEALKKVQAGGRDETTKRVRSFMTRVFGHASALGLRSAGNPARELEGIFTAPATKHHAAITDPKQVGELLRDIEEYRGQPTTKHALRLAPHVFVRPGELRSAEWSEIDLEGAVWSIPAHRTKMRRAHSVPLSVQAVGILRELHEVTGTGRYLFPALHTTLKPISENTLNVALRRLGYGKDEMTSHGFRATASTLLNESGKWSQDAIERALAHKDSDATRAAYHRGVHWEERVRMAQWWSDNLDTLRSGAEVIQLPKRA